MRDLTGRGRLAPFASLRHSDFRFAWSSELLHLWATEMENLVLAWFILVDTGSPVQVGLIGAARFSGTLLSPVYGAVADRLDRRKVQVAARIGSAALASTMLTLVLTHSLQVWHAYVLVLLGSPVRMLGIIVNQAISADAVPGENIGSAMGLNRATTDLSRIFGSLLGGSLMASLGLGPAYVAVTAVYVAATFAALGVAPSPAGGREKAVGYLETLREGLAHVRSSSVLPGVLFFAFLIEMTAFPVVNELMTVLGKDIYGVDAAGVGVMRAVASAGALVGAVGIGALPSIRAPARWMLISVAAWHLLMFPLAAFPPYWIELGILLIWGVAAGASFVLMMVALLHSTPSSLRGRVMGLRALAIYGLPIGLVAGGWIAEQFSPATMLLAEAVTGLALTIAAAFVWPGLRQGPAVETHA